MHSVSRNPKDPSALDFEGTPAELAELFDETMGDEGSIGISFIEVLGLGVEHVHRGAQHNGEAAYGFSLSDAHGDRNVGRLTLIDSKEWFDAIPAWTAYYITEQGASEALATLTARSKRPKVSSIHCDINFERDNPAELLAEWSAEYGISFTLANPHGPGGGLPVYQVSGFTDKIETWLRGPYGLEDSEVCIYLPVS